MDRTADSEVKLVTVPSSPKRDISRMKKEERIMRLDVERIIHLYMTEQDTRHFIWLIQNWRAGNEAYPDHIQAFLDHTDHLLRVDLPQPL